jgi:hypothetical protein
MKLNSETGFGTMHFKKNESWYVLKLETSHGFLTYSALREERCRSKTLKNLPIEIVSIDDRNRKANLKKYPNKLSKQKNFWQHLLKKQIPQTNNCIDNSQSVFNCFPCFADMIHIFLQ